MWPALMAAIRTNAPYVVFPFACIVGVIGYTIEGRVSDKYTPWQESVIKRREKRQLEEQTENGAGSSLENPVDFVPKNVFQKNQSPNLSKLS